MLDYEILHRFCDKFKGQGFNNIDPSDPLVLKLEDQLKANGQFFHIGDLIQLNILYYSKGNETFFGIPIDQMTPSIYYTSTHPDDILRHSISRSKLIKLGMDLYISREDSLIISTNFKVKKGSGEYVNLLFQGYLFFCEAPIETTYYFMIFTDISYFNKNRFGYHYYVGPDLSYFRYPNDQMLSTGKIFSNREFEIIKLIAQGLESEEIANELFLSVHTINTHRRNILNKTGKRTTHELIHELMERGMI